MSSRSSADERAGPNRGKALRAGCVRRRRSAFRQPDVHARGDRFQADQFRLCAGLLLVADAPAAVLRRALRVFTKIFTVGSGTPHYSVELLLAIILWTFFLQSTSGCVQCLLAREGLLRKMRFPRLVVPIAVMLTALFQLATNFIPVLIFAVASGVQPRLTWLLLPVIVGLFAMLAVGIGMLLSVLYIRFRDILPIWDVISQILFYASPIIYPVWYYDKNPKTGEAMAHLHLTLLAKLLMVNPVAALVAEGRRALVAGQQNVNPSASYALGGTVKALIPVAIIAVVFALGVWVFNREAPRISENL